MSYFQEHYHLNPFPCRWAEPLPAMAGHPAGQDNGHKCHLGDVFSPGAKAAGLHIADSSEVGYIPASLIGPDHSQVTGPTPEQQMAAVLAAKNVSTGELAKHI